jgi:hypothetical protein
MTGIFMQRLFKKTHDSGSAVIEVKLKTNRVGSEGAA